MSKYDELNKLENLREKGAISEDEYQREKTKILNSDSKPSVGSQSNSMLGMSLNNYLMVMHLSQFAGFIIPFAGLVAPILLWQINAKSDPEIDRHGKNIMNFMISMIIYMVVGFILVFAVIGMPILVALGVMYIVFIILAAVKANRGEFWSYPLAIPFFS